MAVAFPLATLRRSLRDTCPYSRALVIDAHGCIYGAAPPRPYWWWWPYPPLPPPPPPPPPPPLGPPPLPPPPAPPRAPVADPDADPDADVWDAHAGAEHAAVEDVGDVGESDVAREPYPGTHVRWTQQYDLPLDVPVLF